MPDDDVVANGKSSGSEGGGASLGSFITVHPYAAEIVVEVGLLQITNRGAQGGHARVGRHQRDRANGVGQGAGSQGSGAVLGDVVEPTDPARSSIERRRTNAHSLSLFTRRPTEERYLPVMSNPLSAQAPGAVDPGYTTTEFWQTLLLHVIAGVVAIGTLISNNFKLNGVQAVVPSAAVVAAAIGQVFYSMSRAKVKSAAQTASGQAKVAEASLAQAEAVKAVAQTATARVTSDDPGADRAITITVGAGLGGAIVKTS
jgi:hypothetical protein